MRSKHLFDLLQCDQMTRSFQRHISERNPKCTFVPVVRKERLGDCKALAPLSVADDHGWAVGTASIWSLLPCVGDPPFNLNRRPLSLPFRRSQRIPSRVRSSAHGAADYVAFLRPISQSERQRPSATMTRLKTSRTFAQLRTSYQRCSTS